MVNGVIEQPETKPIVLTTKLLISNTSIMRVIRKTMDLENIQQKHRKEYRDIQNGSTYRKYAGAVSVPPNSQQHRHWTTRATFCLFLFKVPSPWSFCHISHTRDVRDVYEGSFGYLAGRTSSYFLSASSARNRASFSWFSKASIRSSSVSDRFSRTLRAL